MCEEGFKMSQKNENKKEKKVRQNDRKMKKYFPSKFQHELWTPCPHPGGFIFGFCGTHVSDLGGIIGRTPGWCRRHRKKDPR